MMEAPDHREEEAAAPRVYISREDRRRQNGRLLPGIDTSKATSFGRRIYVFDQDVKPWNPARAVKSAQEVLAEFDAGTDYLLLIGPPILCAIILTVAVDRARFDSYTHVRVLYWHQRLNTYEEVAVPVAQADWGE